MGAILTVISVEILASKGNRVFLHKGEYLEYFSSNKAPVVFQTIGVCSQTIDKRG